MNTFDRHLLREWLQILGLVLAATCGLLVVQILYDDFPRLREDGARGWELWGYVGVRMPSYLTVVMPFALLVSLLYVLGTLHRANELTAMRAAGVGFLRLTAPVWAVGVVCCGVAWWLNTTVAPWSVEQSAALSDRLEFRHEAKTLTEDYVGATKSVAFDNAHAGRMWFFNRYSRFTQRGYGVSVSELDASRRETKRIVAAQAWPEPGKPGWMFANGRELTFAPESGEFVADLPFVRKYVDSYHEDPQLMLLIDRKPIDLSLHELRRLIDYLEGEHSPKAVNYEVRYFGVMADTLMPLIVIALAIPFAVSGVRVNPAVGASKSIGLFALYYMLANLSGSLANTGVVDAATAAWLPNAGMAALAVWFFARLR